MLINVYHQNGLIIDVYPLIIIRVRTGLLAGSMVLSNINERLSNIDGPKMFTVVVKRTINLQN